MIVKGQPSTIRCWIGLALCICISVRAAGPATTIIDAGSDKDSNFTGGTAYTIPNPPTGLVDLTLRYGSFVYDVPCHDEWPYLVTFRFIEPTVQGAGQRIFSVRINNQLVISNIDLFAEASFLKPLSRSVLAFGAGGHLIIKFETVVRSAVVSSIEFTPLLQILALPE